MPSTKTTPLVALATLWVSNSLAEAGSGAWGSSCSRGHHRRNHYNHQNHLRNEGPAVELAKDLFYMPTYPNSLMRQQGFREPKMEPTPHFEVTESDDGTVELVMEVPGLSARDLNIELENDQVLRVNGIRTKHKDGFVSQVEFEEKIRLRDRDDVDNLKVNLSSGLLTITVPQKPTNIKKLPISSDEHGSILDSPKKKKKPKDEGGDTV